MKKQVLSILLVSASLIGFSQNEFKNVESDFVLGKYEEAKIGFEKAIAKNPGLYEKGDGWIWKCRVLCEMIANPATAAKYPGSLNEAYEAFIKYEEKDPQYTTISSSSIGSLGWRVLDVLYTNNFTTGRKFYQEKAYDSAYFYYDRCCHFSKIVMKLDLRKNGGVLDTIPVMMAGYSAQNAQKMQQAIDYYTLAINKNYAPEDASDVYKYVLVGYSELKDRTSFDKYFDLAKARYPKENWDDYKLDYISKNSSLEDKVLQYDKEDAASSLDATGYMYFGDMFANLPKEEKEKIEKDPIKKALFNTKAIDCFKKAFNKDNKEILGAFNAGVLYYKEQEEFDTKYRDGIKALQEINQDLAAKKTAEKDPKKKAALDASFKDKIDTQKKANADSDGKMINLADNSIEWLEKAVPLLQAKNEKSKNEQKSLKNAVNFLTNLWDFKRNKAKGRDPKAFDAAEVKYKYYDELYGKL